MAIRGGSLEGAIATTVAYFDVFAFAPRSSEIHRFLVGRRATRAEVELSLHASPSLAQALGTREGCWFLRGKDHLAPRRVRFARHATSLWPRARSIARTIERSGLAVAGLVTGSLAADNADEHADIDFLLIYPTERTWTSFLAMRLLAKVPVGALGSMCPNYALALDRLEIRPQNLFTAWEIAKAIPVFGFAVVERFVRANAWVARYLPNALPQLDSPCTPEDPPADPRLVRRILQTTPFRRIEAMERERKVGADVRDVGVDMAERAKQGSMDRHSPTRSFHALSELRYRMEHLEIVDHPLYGEIEAATRMLASEMARWGAEPMTPSISSVQTFAAKR